MDIEAQPFDLRDCVESALDLVSARAAEKHLDTAYVFEGDVPPAISGDVTRLRQIMLNLLSNAVKFTERGEVVLTVTRRAGCGGRRRAHLRRARHRHRPVGGRHEPAVPVVLAGRLVDDAQVRRHGPGPRDQQAPRRADGRPHVGGERRRSARGRRSSFTIQAPPLAELPPASRRDFVGTQPALVGQADARRRRQRHQPSRARRCRLRKWGMAPRDTESPEEALRWLEHGEAFDLAILDMHMPEMDGVAARAAAFAHCVRSCRSCCSARSAGARRDDEACSPRRSRSRSASRSSSTRW